MSAPLLGAGALAYAGFAALCLGTARGRRQIPAAAVVPAPVLLGAGWALLAASLLPCLRLPNPGVGVVAWLGLLTVAAAPLTLGMGAAPRLAALAGPGAALLAAFVGAVL